MDSLHLLPAALRTRYEVREWHHASAVLAAVYPSEWRDILAVLRTFRLYKSDITTPGGRKSPVATRLDSAFYARGWKERKFNTRVTVDGVERDVPTHKVDCVKSKVALEVEWSNKDPFFDRDLNNFRLLFDLRAVDVGVVVTRADELQDLFDDLGRGKSYGQSTTHMSKLMPRIHGGGAGGCPVLAFGITKAVYVERAAP